MLSRALVLPLGAALILAAATPLAAAPAAAPIRECGDLSSELAYNITSRAVSCATARRVVRAWDGRGTGPVRGMFCRYRDIGYEAGDIRCTATGGRVVRWQTGV